MDNNGLIKKIQQQFPHDVEKCLEEFGLLTVTIRRSTVVSVLQFLRDDAELAFEFFSDLAGVDYLEMGGPERFAVIYNLYSLKYRHRIFIKVFVPESDAKLDSVGAVFAGANWAEREVYDQFGLYFNGHPDLRRILNPDDFVGHPLRKDFPAKGVGYRESFEKIVRETAQ